MSPLGLPIGFEEEAPHSKENTKHSFATTTRPCAATRTIAGKYRLEGVIGEGGMGAVWRAFNLQLELPVAVKLLHAGSHGPEGEERLRLEARAAAKLVHPGIVRVFDVGESEASEPFIVMELLSGESLAAALERGPLSPVDAVQLLLPIAEALALAHSRGVVHRDLKPDNIFVAVEGGTVQPKLLDFGIAKVTSIGPVGSAKLTRSGTLLGSPDYMSPEQALGHDVDERSDIWSFCVILYEALSGRLPFSASSCQALLRSIVWDEHLPLEPADGVDAKLSELVRRGLEKTPDHRYASVFELGQALASWLIDQGVHEDITGSSVAARWFGRQRDSSVSVRNLPLTPRALHDQATLVSLAPPASRPDSVAATPNVVPSRGARRRLSRVATAVAPLAVLGLAVTLGTAPLLVKAASASPAPTSTSASAPSRIMPASTQAGSKPEERPIVTQMPQVEPRAPSAAARVVGRTPARPLIPTKRPIIQTLESNGPLDLIDPYESSWSADSTTTTISHQSSPPKHSLIFP